MKRLKGFITNSSSTSFIMTNDGFMYSTDEFIELAEDFNNMELERLLKKRI